MANKVRIKWNLQEFEAIRSSPGVQELVESECERLADAANTASPITARYGYSTQQGETRFRGIVFTDNYRAQVDNSRHNTLLKVL